MSFEDLPQLYQHRNRRDWGLAILAWEGRDKRRYQFQDGQARTFKEGYFELLEEVDEAVDVAVEVVAELEQKLDLTRARREVIARAKSEGRDLVTLDDQRRIFEHLHPGGFDDPDYVASVRGEGADVRRKGHLSPAVAEAREKLGGERLRGLIAARDFDAVFASAVKVLDRTSLTSGKAHVGHLQALPEGRREAFAHALVDALWGHDDFEPRFDRLVAAMTHGGEAPSWQLATAFAALTHAERHVCVKPSVFRAQARWMAPRLEHDATPSGATYLRYRAMAVTLRDRLREADHTPRDLLDVYTFIWTTLRPAAKALLAELPRG